jgi:dolichol-phosphate mannosyltransferase
MAPLPEAPEAGPAEGQGDGSSDGPSMGWMRARMTLFLERLGQERQRFLRFAVVGASGVLVNFAFLALGLWFFSGLAGGPRETIASALGIVMSVLSNFLLNDAWTWGDRKKGTRKRDVAYRLSTYVIGAAIAAGLQFGIAALLRASFDAHVYLAQAAGIAVGTVVNYLISNHVVFKDKK